MPKFFYYIIFTENNKFLVGLDILDRCDFHHNKYGYFVITDFDYKDYERHYIKFYNEKLESMQDLTGSINEIVSDDVI